MTDSLSVCPLTVAYDSSGLNAHYGTPNFQVLPILINYLLCQPTDTIVRPNVIIDMSNVEEDCEPCNNNYYYTFDMH